MRHCLAFFTSLILALFVSQAARAAHIEVDLSSQTMRVSSDQGDYVWPISSARTGYSTPRGTYGVQRLEVMHRSHKYHNSPMPHSIFFHGGYAIHGTYETAALGEPASHGCVRIAPENAALLFELVKAEGASITITGSPLETTRYARAEHRHDRATRYAARHLQPQALGYASEPRGVPTLEDWFRAPGGESADDD